MSNVKRIAIVEDHTLLRQSLEFMLASELDFDVVGFATNGKDAIELANSVSPDLILMDISLPVISGIEAMIEIKKRSPLIKILILTVHTDKQFVREALIAGADGYCVKYETQTELMYAIRNVLGGKPYLSPYIINLVISGYLADTKKSNEDLLWGAITHREREIIKLIAEGYINQDISELMSLSLKTVKTHRANIMKKLDLHNVVAITAYAIAKGLVVSNSILETQILPL